MTASIKNLVFKVCNSVIIPIKNKPIEFISKIFALVGGYYSLCEIEQAVLSTSVLLDFFRKNLLVFLLGIVIIAISMHAERLSHVAFLGEKDILLSLCIGDILTLKKSQ